MKRPVNPKLLLMAMLFAAVLAGGIGAFALLERQHLLNQGVETTGVVVSIDVQARGSRSVEARFVTPDGQVVVGRDLHKTQWADANKVGEQVALFYDPKEPEKILISRGIWIWSNPALMIASGIFLFGLGVFIYRQSTAKHSSS